MIALPFLVPAPPFAVEGRWCFGCGSRRLPMTYHEPARSGVVRVRWTEDICDRCLPEMAGGRMPGTSPQTRGRRQKR